MSNFRLGEQALVDAFNSGQRLDKFLTTLALEPTIFPEAVDALVYTYWGFVRAGVVAPKHDDPSMDMFLHAGEHAMLAVTRPRVQRYDRKWLDVHLTAIARVLQPYAGTNPISLSTPSPVVPPEPQAMPVRVVGMPERITESSVAYDAAGNIKSTKQTEMDAHKSNNG